MKYNFKVPVIIKVFGDETEDSLKPSVLALDYVTKALTNEASVFGDFLPRPTYDAYQGVVISRYNMGVTISISTIEAKKTEKTVTDLTRAVMLWMKYGIFEGGMTLKGRYYGYSYDEVVVYTWDEELKIELANVEP